MTEIIETGGARIGVANATWPFATLKVCKDRLELNATIIGSLIFKPNDIVSIVPEQGFLSRGLRIIHNVPTYKKKVIFWTFGNPAELLIKIEQTGFLVNKSPLPKDAESEILASQSTGGFPIKLSAMITFGVVWNLLFIWDFINFMTGDKQSSPLGIGALLALGFAFSTGILILAVAPFRKLILKEKRDIKDINRFIYFMLLVCGLMIISIAFSNGSG